jgi:hypothetical protein
MKRAFLLGELCWRINAISAQTSPPFVIFFVDQSGKYEV